VIPLLLGLKESMATKKARQLLSDAGTRYKYEDILRVDSSIGQMMVAITGSTVVPQLFVGGDSYVGEEQVRRYIRN
jgi:glutaredoxin